MHHGRKVGKVYVLFSFSFRWVAHTVAQILEVDYSSETEAEWPKRERSPLEWDPAGQGRIPEWEEPHCVSVVVHTEYPSGSVTSHDLCESSHS